MINVIDLYKNYGNVEVLKGISLNIMPHKLTTIVGASGAGKTTLLQIMATLESPDRGKVLYSDKDVTLLRDKELSTFRNLHIGLVFQQHRLLPEFTIEENVMMPALLAGRSRRQAAAMAAERLRELGLGHRLNHRPAELSGGECQRASVARAIINNPSVILADEPTGSLDSANRRQLHDIFFELRDKFGTTFVIVTHDDTLADGSDIVIHMADGKITKTVS
ncbi:MAG: ABC transporter ATP-binding protein [Muribaculaceae bacterium]|nr:ABC transporter ATP-binding protein [Muribaculaceae bacterium]